MLMLQLGLINGRNWPSHCLAIYGPSGSGKTHLLHVWLAKNGGRLIAPKIWMKKMRLLWSPGTNALAIDNAEDIAVSAAREETLLHIFNMLRESKRLSAFDIIPAARAVEHQACGFALPPFRCTLDSACRTLMMRFCRQC